MTPAHALRSTKRASTCSVARARTGTHACERVHACMHSASSPGGLRCVCAAGIIARTRPAGESRKNCSAGRQCVWPCPRAGERHRTHAHNRHEASERARGRETCSTAACKSQWPARVKFAHARAGARARTHCPICRCTAIPGGGEPWSYVQRVRAGESTGEIGAGKYSSALCSVRCTFRPRPAVSAAASRPGDGGCPTHRPRSGATARRQLPAARRGGAPRARAGSPAKHTRNSAYAWPPARPEEQRARGTTDGGGERTTRTPARLRPGKAATTHTHKASAAARSAMP